MTRLVTTLESLKLQAIFGDSLIRFRDLFAKWNQKINLSAASTLDEIEEHIIDSLHAVVHLKDATEVVDVGSGGGLPVVVTALCLPATHFVALEPTHKKHAFLRTAAREIPVPNLEALAVRQEDFPHRGTYDAAMSRATFDLREWILRGLDLVRVGGVVLGFEAVQRDDLPTPFERHSYDLDGKQRSIIVATRTV